MRINAQYIRQIMQTLAFCDHTFFAIPVQIISWALEQIRRVGGVDLPIYFKQMHLVFQIILEIFVVRQDSGIVR